MASGDGFLSRWSQRKAGARGRVAEAGAESAPAPTPGGPAHPSPPAASPPPLAPALPVEPAPLPTLEDVARLTHASDFSPYVARNVDAGVRNAAMKKLFSDPHFNIMDGLDTYIDDYGKPDPIPISMLRRMNQAASLGLFADESPTGVPDDALEAPAAEACPDGAGRAPMAQSDSVPLPPETPTRADDDPDLQLQRDDSDRRPGPEPSARG